MSLQILSTSSSWTFSSTHPTQHLPIPPDWKHNCQGHKVIVFNISGGYDRGIILFLLKHLLHLVFEHHTLPVFCHLPMPPQPLLLALPLLSCWIVKVSEPRAQSLDLFFIYAHLLEGFAWSHGFKYQSIPMLTKFISPAQTTSLNSMLTSL